MLRVDAVYEDVAFNKTMAVAVNGEIKDLACWLHLDARLPRRP